MKQSARNVTRGVETTQQPTDESNSDSDLVRAAQRGDRGAFDRLVLRHRDRLYLSVRSTMDCPLLAEDIVQDAFLRAFEFLPSFKHQSAFYSWLYRIALNVRVNQFRQRQRALQPESPARETIASPSVTRESPACHAEREELQLQVRKALATLDDDYRQILVLREFEKLDYKSIAAILAIKLGTVRSRLARARARLRAALANYQSERLPSAGMIGLSRPSRTSSPSVNPHSDRLMVAGHGKLLPPERTTAATRHQPTVCL